MTTFIVLFGATGNMGLPFVKTVLATEGLELVACSSRKAAGSDIVAYLGLTHPQPIPCFATAQEALAHACLSINPRTDRLISVDVTHPSTVYENTLASLHLGARPVIGATGMTTDQLATIDALLKQHGLPGGLFPNFSIGAVLLMQFAKQASKYFNHAEIIELHHNRKADAPSGTSLHTAELMHQGNPLGFGHSNGPEHETLTGARGGRTEGGLHIHSVRLPGLVAHQEVLFAEAGQLLTLRHDSFNRECFMAGMVLACRHLHRLPVGLTQGLEHVLALTD